MESRLGLTPEELISIFNQMYLEVWDKTRDKVDWEVANVSRQMQEGKEVDLSDMLLRLMEVVVTAARDGAIMAMYYNNEKIYDDLRAAGVTVPDRPPAPEEVGVAADGEE